MDAHRELNVDAFKRAAKRLRRTTDVSHHDALNRLARACGFQTFDEVAVPARVFRPAPRSNFFRSTLEKEWGDALNGWASDAIDDLYDNIFQIVFITPKTRFREEQRKRGIRKKARQARAERRAVSRVVEEVVADRALHSNP